MIATERRPLRHLTPALAQNLQTFNNAARQLQLQGIRMHQIDPVNNSLTISPEDGKALLRAVVRPEGYTRQNTAGSTRCQFQYLGVTVKWIEPISYRDYAIH